MPSPPFFPVTICFIFDKDSFRISEKLVADIRQYIDDNYVDEHEDKLEIRRRRAIFSKSKNAFGIEEDEIFEVGSVCKDMAEPSAAPAPLFSAMGSKPSRPLDAYIKELDESFSEMLLRKISEKGMKDSECYKKANIDRKLFSKIKNDKLYKPSKPTAIAFAIALELSLSETEEMLKKAGFALSH